MPEIDLTAAASLPEGVLQSFPTPHDGPEVLLVRHAGAVHAFAAHCPHYGAPLAKGRLVNGKIVCPWHHACFRVADGHLCEPPALDDLPAFAVREAAGRVLVQVPEQPAASTDDPSATPTAEVGGTPPADAAGAPADTRTFAIVGGGAAGQYAAQTLRQQGFAGRIVLVTADEKAPYDRTKLSKPYLAGKAQPAALPLRTPDFYERHRIELRLNTRATGLDLQRQEIQLDSQPPLRYDQLLLAPGGAPNRLPKLPGHDLAGVLPLRTQADADAILAATKTAQQVVVIGSSFIGMEATSSLVGEGRTVTVVAQDKVPFLRVLGPEIGAMFRALHEERGVRFEADAEVTALLGEAGRVTGVQLKTGRVLPADAVVLGVGVRPATGFLQDALPLERDGGLAVNEYLQAAENVYAAGDIARFPLGAPAVPTRIEHWRVAQQHGRTAARNMLGQREAFTAAPYFWTQQYGKSLRYAGHAENWDQIIYHGEVAKQEFLALYVLDNRIVAAAGMNRDADMIYVAERLEQGRMPAPAQVREDMDWAAGAN
ncbi:FAD-dependent oxidoreductase [Hymenobacter caeli]|uniref:NADPH-dependent 2,4-dienoyl-CoA reductase/sulfur reductase-like enzyme/nitrite reductase/ring-hydroxylating ferredoxin subunit n=1 Tax=Hymenobacter caeli TaxID=2735894 RepID=A0ABX2FNZ7_9BACT|nr:FAD-dependent oxidoreductase [Hymenobacter caeli]NRT18897.1 NADPH-dependent 2,4-dienoyl-CoA reductase/sulfur reductase-like enzyme/nitrite reductase/ring-hydroxylating ferredoxin subunit [Hymenobacter caeli]